LGLGHSKIFFSRTTGLILTRLGTNLPWTERIQESLKEEDSPSLRRDKGVKIHRKNLKVFSRTSRPKSIKTWYKLSFGEEFKFVQIKGQALFNGDNHRNVRNGWGHLSIILKTYEARKAEF
jgi:hypothetical protein